MYDDSYWYYRVLIYPPWMLKLTFITAAVLLVQITTRCDLIFAKRFFLMFLLYVTGFLHFAA
jgi:hypothetical protein